MDEIIFMVKIENNRRVLATGSRLKKNVFQIFFISIKLFFSIPRIFKKFFAFKFLVSFFFLIATENRNNLIGNITLADCEVH